MDKDMRHTFSVMEQEFINFNVFLLVVLLLLLLYKTKKNHQ